MDAQQTHEHAAIPPHGQLEQPPTADGSARARRRVRALAVACVLVYLPALASVTLNGSDTGAMSGPAGNVVPFRSIWHQLLDPAQSFGHRAYYLVGNLLLMAPLAVAVVLWRWWSQRAPRRWPSWSSTVAIAALLAAGLSAAVELLQWQVIDGRAGDVDDVLLNTAGAGLTTLLLEHLHRAARRTSL